MINEKNFLNRNSYAFPALTRHRCGVLNSVGNKRGALAISQILILVVSMVAISYAVGSGVGIVSAEEYVYGIGDTTDIIVRRREGTQMYEYFDPSVNAWGQVDSNGLAGLDTFSDLESELVDAYISSFTSPPSLTSPSEVSLDTTSKVTTSLPDQSNLQQEDISPVFSQEKISSSPAPSHGMTRSFVKPETQSGPQIGGAGGVAGIGGAGTTFAGGGSGNPSASSFVGPSAPTTTAATGVDGVWGGLGKGFLGNIVSGAGYALAVWGIIRMVGPMLGLDDSQTDAASMAAAAGIMAGYMVYGAFEQWGASYLEVGAGSWTGVSSAGLWATGIGVAVAAIMFYLTYEDTETELFTYDCIPWEPPTGGNSCEECNTQGDLPCGEYQCRSLGQSCELLNPGTGEEKCAWINPNDIKFPVIEPLEQALLDDYTYTPDKTISPPDRGVNIVYGLSADGCAPAFTPLSFGINANEPAKCRIDYLRKNSYDEMEFFFGGNSLLRYNHTQAMVLPGVSGNLTLRNDGEYQLYVRCQDANGNYNTANFVFQFCVDKGPDTTAPLIVGTNILNNKPIAFNQSSIDIEVYTNELADCKWSHRDQSYENMENEMECCEGSAESCLINVNTQLLYPCASALTGLKDREENDFYFKCRDRALDENTNSESYKLTLIGTQQLLIDDVGPNETISDSASEIKITLTAKTSAGYSDGASACFFKESDADDGDYVLFAGDSDFDNHEHSQELWFSEGIYEYSIKCIDLGGNFDIKNTTFAVETDSDAPSIVRAFHEGEYLRVITNEQAACVYDTKDCSYQFDDGIQMTLIDDTNHYTDWDTSTDLFVKCQDKFGNEPVPPNTCSMIVRAFGT